jgi:hypothetical protein
VNGEASAVVMIGVTEREDAFLNQGRSSTVTNGAFAIESLAPGTYYVFAVDRMEPARYFEPQIAQRIKAEATVVKVSEGSTISVKLQTIGLN